MAAGENTGEFGAVSILLVEDQLFLRTMMARMLGDIGFRQIHTARDGEEAMTRLASETVDIVLCDLKMPNMDGFDFLKKLREAERPEIAQVPVVALTGVSDADSVHRLRALGISGYIVKPASIRAIVDRVRSALKGARKAAPA
jgi:two-component system, chemotaxis family, chemotaxis protein CheY